MRPYGNQMRAVSVIPFGILKCLILILILAQLPFVSASAASTQSVYFKKTIGTKTLGELCGLPYECDTGTLPLICLEESCQCDPDVSAFAESVDRTFRKFVNTPDGLRFKCKELDKYIPDAYVCNGLDDCGDFSDEEFCGIESENPISDFGSSCVGLVDQPCINQNCVPKAECGVLEMDVCSCSTFTGYLKIGDKCVKGHDANCSAIDTCAPEFSCVNGKCECWSPDFQIYDPVNHLCRGIVGSTCDGRWNPSRACVENAVCELNKRGQYVCTCDDGFVENKNGACDVIYGGNCTLNSDCDSAKKLVCRNNVCKCRNHVAVYDKELRKCVIPDGLRCDDSHGFSCVKNAHCVLGNFVHGMAESGHCECYSGFDEC